MSRLPPIPSQVGRRHAILIGSVFQRPCSREPPSCKVAMLGSASLVRGSNGCHRRSPPHVSPRCADQDNITAVLLGMSAGQQPQRIMAAGHSLGAALRWAGTAASTAEQMHVGWHCVQSAQL